MYFTQKISIIKKHVCNKKQEFLEKRQFFPYSQERKIWILILNLPVMSPLLWSWLIFPVIFLKNTLIHWENAFSCKIFDNTLAYKTRPKCLYHSLSITINHRIPPFFFFPLPYFRIPVLFSQSIVCFPLYSQRDMICVIQTDSFSSEITL